MIVDTNKIADTKTKIALNNLVNMLYASFMFTT
jgi:hypothetical protein